MHESLAAAGLFQPLSSDRTVDIGQREPKWLFRAIQQDNALDELQRDQAVSKLQEQRRPVTNRLRQTVFRA